MQLNLSDVLAGHKQSITEIVKPELGQYVYYGDTYELECEPIAFKITNISKGRARLEAELKFKTVIPCDRCLTPVTKIIEAEIFREVSSPDAEIRDEEDESRDFMSGYELDCEALLYNEITVNWPVQVLCREDCKGLCPVCGQNLNERDCGCDTFVPDPRMSALKDIFEKSKEV